MSDTNSKLMIMIEANTRSYQNSMKKLEKMTSATFDKAERSTQRYNKGIKSSGFAVANLSAQFNDIGVMVAAGQSPLQLAMQQGTQIGQIFMQAGGDVKSAGKLISSSLMQVVSPVNLLTIGLIAGGSALIQWAMSAVSAGEDVDDLEERLKKTRETLSNLDSELRGLRLGVSSDEVTLLDAIALQTQEVASAQDRLSNGRKMAEQGARTRLVAEQKILDELDGQLAKLRNLQQEKETLQKVTKATADAERLVGEQMARTVTQSRESVQIADLLRSGVTATTIEAIKFAGVDLSSPVISAVDAAKLLEIGLSEGQIRAIEFAGTSISGPITEAANEAARLAEMMFLASRAGMREDLADEDLLFGQQVVPDSSVRAGHRNALNNFQSLMKARAKASKSGGAGSSQAKQVEREQKSINELIASLEREIELVGVSDLVRKQANATRNIGASATDEQRAKIEQLTETLHDEELAWDRAQVAQEFFESSIQSSLDGLISGAKDAKEVVEDLGASIADAAFKALMFNSGPLGSGTGGGILGSLLGGLLGRAGGGNVSSSMPYLVGERGPELFIPHTAGKIAANQNSGSGASVVRLELSGDVEGRILQQSAGQSLQIVKATSPHIVSQSVSSTAGAIKSGRMDGPMNSRYSLSKVARKR